MFSIFVQAWRIHKIVCACKWNHFLCCCMAVLFICWATICFHSAKLGSKSQLSLWFGLVYGVYPHFQQYFSYIMAFSFIGGGNRSIQRKPLTCRKSLTNFTTYHGDGYIEVWLQWKGFSFSLNFIISRLDYTRSLEDDVIFQDCIFAHQSFQK